TRFSRDWSSDVCSSDLVIAEERHQRLRIIELPDGVQTLDVSNSPRLTIAIDDSDNLSFEGLSWNASEQKLLLVRERDPLRVLVEIGRASCRERGESAGA